MMRLSSLLQVLVIAVVFLLLTWLEIRRPLRRSVESKLNRELRNFGMIAVSTSVLLVVERPFIDPLVALVSERKWGILNLASLPPWLTIPLAIILLDYTLYIWHVLTHKVPWLWRMHVVHHADLDLDASTAFRFHFAEMAVSIGWRAGQVVLIGVSPSALAAWRLFVVLSVMFHHSNVRLPIGLERIVNKCIITPRMHGIHHSIVRQETNSNWSSGLTIWDWLHGTIRLNVPQDEIVIGVPAYREPRELGLKRLLAMPFRAQRPSWIDSSGKQPTRSEDSAPREYLLR